jgi:multicomponent Na+:H+ antiporter subunit C
MDSAAVFSLAGIGLFLLGLRALLLRPHLLHKILAFNVMGSGVFLVLVAPAAAEDPIPQAMVITGIVVAVSATALALNLMLKVVDATGQARVDRETAP